MGRGKTYPASAARHLLHPLRRLVQPPARIIHRMSLRHTDIVLEVGCGPGWFSHSIAASVPEGRLVACDLQPSMLSMARDRTAGFDNVHPVAVDATALPFVDSAFDAVLVAVMLGEVHDRVACLRELRRIVRPSGSITLVETRRDSDFIARTELVDLAAQSGLAVTTTWGWRWEYTARLVPQEQ